VAKREMDLLSIKCDDTLPYCLFYDQSRDKYVIVDGFHRYTIMLRYKNIFERENGMLPAVIEKTSVIEWHPPFDTTEREENTRWNYKLH
jgi:hypothetical protein